MKYLVIILFLPLSFLAQDELQVVKVNEDKDFKKNILERNNLPGLSSDQNGKKRPGELNIVLADERIQVLDDYIKDNPLDLTGFRIQLVFGNRNTVNNAKSTFYQNFNEIPLYESYLAPNFRLRVGDFITRLQAESELHKIREVFPSAYIVNDQINIPEYVTEDY